MEVVPQIISEEQFSYVSHRRLTGGDINDVYYVKTEEKEIVIKLNSSHKFPKMFEMEAEGLNELRTTNSFIIPEVISYGKTDQYSYLLLAYLQQDTSRPDWKNFGTSLANLHRHQQSDFGFKNNYIGSLPQQNNSEQTAAAFYNHQRLQPQFRLAEEKGFQFERKESLLDRLDELLPDEPASLIHGDLWNGNYLTTPQGFALIDPAVAYSIREMDLAMMRLFGGFPDAVFQAYQNHFPLISGWEQRVELYQLYYLMVHLNIFGSSYLSSVNHIIKKYTS